MNFYFGSQMIPTCGVVVTSNFKSIPMIIALDISISHVRWGFEKDLGMII
jgi:hypothetical protein